MTVPNVTDDVDQQEFLSSVSQSFFTWMSASLLPKLILFIVVLAVGVACNILLVGVAHSSKLLKHSVHVFLFQLAVLDLLAAFFVVLPIVVNVFVDDGGHTTKGICKLHAVLFNWFLMVNVALHDVMIIERAVQAVAADGSKYHLQTFGNNCFVRLLSTGIWLIFLLVASLLVLTTANDVTYRGTQYQCAIDFAKHPGTMHALFSITVYSSLIVFLISFFVILYIRREKIRNQQGSLKATEPSRKEDAPQFNLPSSHLNNSNQNKSYAITPNVKNCASDVTISPDLTMKNVVLKNNAASVKGLVQKYVVTHHTEKSGESKVTSVFHIDKVSPGIFFRPLLKPLRSSNVRVDAKVHTESQITENVPIRTSIEQVLYGSKENDDRPVALKNTPEKEIAQKEKQKLALPHFKSKQLWIKTRRVLTVGNTPLSLFRDVPHDLQHHQTMTYAINWFVTYFLWIIYVIAAFTEVYGATCHVCYRVGVLLGLASYSVRPLVVIAHNRWYREQCRQEMKKLVKYVRSCCS